MIRFELDEALKGLEVYCVGGAVRDDLLGIAHEDRDWVIVGATIDEMHQRGFRPVGRDFPVFLHPHTHEEYALARTERDILAELCREANSTYAIAERLGISQPSVVRKLRRHGLRIERSR